MLCMTSSEALFGDRSLGTERFGLLTQKVIGGNAREGDADRCIY